MESNPNPENPLVAAILDDVKPTKSVICSVLAFLEAVEEDIEKPEGGSPLRIVRQQVVKANGIVSQDRRVPQHLARFGLPIDIVGPGRTGRKTPLAGIVIPRLVTHLESQGFDSAERSQKVQMIHAVSELFRSMLGLSLGPIRVTSAGATLAALVEEVLAQAEARGIVSAIAELLVGSKLEVCIGGQRGRAIAAQHKWDNGHDDPSALGDYRIDNVAIEVTMVKGPDESHRTKANTITARGTDECWLIVRSDKIKAWQDYIARVPSRYPNLVRCYGICEFIGQNLTETRWRSIEPGDPLSEVVAKLNELVARLGSQFLPAAKVELFA
jgi:hypothetical protein